MSDDNTMKFNVLMEVQQAIRGIDQLSASLDKLKEKKLTGNISEGLKQELASARNIVNAEGANINKALNNIGNDSSQGITKYVQGYKQAISGMVSDIEKYNRLFKDTGNIEYSNKAQAMIPQVRALNAEHEALNKTIGLNAKSVGTLDNAFSSLKSHAAWLASSAIIGGAIALPTLAIKSMADIESQMAGMLQTLPSLYKDYPNHIVDQKALNDTTMEFIGIGQRYGEEVDKIIESGKLWSRGYKDVNDVMKLTGNSAKLALADNMDVGLANRSVEATINAYKRQDDAINFSNHIVDSFTNVSHNAQASATDLSEALIRSANAANVVGISFDSVTAQAASMIKATGQSGSIVGNALKSLYSSINTKKGREGLADLGVELYKLDTDGTKHLRNMEAVLMDIMIATQGTSKSLQTDIVDLVGGKMQWSRVAGLLGSYADYIKNYNLSLQSSGAADRQILAQLDTITRKAEQVKASMQGVIMGAADSGAARAIKDTLDSINSFLKGLQQIPSGVYSAMGSLAKWSTEIYIASTALKFLESGIVALNTVKAADVIVSSAEATALNAEAAAAGRAAVSMGALGAATTVTTGGLNLLLAGLIAAGTAGAIYATSVGDAVTQSDNLKQHSIDLLSVKQQDYDMSIKQTEFIGTLGNAYNEFDAKLKATGESTVQGIEIRKSMTATETELKNIVGEAGLERLRSAGFTQEAIKAEQDTHSTATASIKTEINSLKDAQNQFTDNQITNTEKRIDSLIKETEALSIWRRAQIAAYDVYAGLMEKQISFKETLFNNMPDFMQGEKSQLAQSIDSDRAYRESLKATSREGLNNDIAQARADLAKLRSEKLQRSMSKYSTGSTIGGDEIEDKPSTKKVKNPKTNNGAATPPSDHEEEIFRLEKDREVDHMFKEAKVSADQYSSSLELLDARESMFGFSTANSNDKLALQNKRIFELIGQAMEYQELSSDYSAQAEEKINSNADLVASLDALKVKWSDLSKEEKRAFIQSNKDYIQDEKSLLRLLELADKLKVAAADASHNANGLGITTAKETKDLPRKQYQEKTQDNEYDKNHDIFNLGYNATQSKKNVVELKYASMELYDAQTELNRVTKEYGKDSQEFKKAQAEVDRLKTKVDELNNKQTDKLKGEISDMIIDWSVKGRGFSDIWKNIWQEFQTDAIKSLLGVKHEASSLAQILGGSSGSGGLFGFLGGLFGGRGASVAASTFGGNVSSISNSLLPTAFPHASGGIFDTAHLGLVAEAGKEAIIPLENNKERGKSLWTQAGQELEMFNKGTNVSADIPTRTVAIAQQASAETKANREHIAELEKQTALMTTMVGVLMNNQGNQGNNGNQIQPIVMSQSMDKGELWAMIESMRRDGYRV